MKHVFNTNEVPSVWLKQQQSDARNQQGNLYFEGKTIYSYGRHFPVAQILDEKNVLFTLDSYSNTTAKHIRNVGWECRKKDMNLIYTHNMSNKDAAIETWENKINDVLDEIKKPSNRKFEGRISNLRNHISQLKTFVNYFKLELSFKTMTLMSFIEGSTNEEILKLRK